MKIIISALLILFALKSFSQNSAPNTYTLTKSVISKATTMSDFISDFPKEHVLINFGIAYFVKNKAKSANGDVTFDALKKILKEADSKSEVHMELKYKSGENKTDATYVFKITE
jgi:hypothetical protein